MPGTVPRAAGRVSAAGQLDVVALGLEGVDDGLAVVALQLDDAVLGRAADAAALLEPAGELADLLVAEREVEDGRRGLALAAGGLAPHLDRARGGAGHGLRIARLAQVAVGARPHHVGGALGHARSLPAMSY